MSIQPIEPIPPWYTPPAGDPAILEATVRISSGTGWIDLNDKVTYELHRDTLNNRQASFRRSEATNPYVMGSFTVNAVPDNVEENLSVWVYADTHSALWSSINRLTNALSQVSFTLEVRIEDYAVRWNCHTADYTVNTQAEFIHNIRGLVTAQVPRHPLPEQPFILS